MRWTRTMTGGLAALLATTATAQQRHADIGKRAVEQPIKRSLRGPKAPAAGHGAPVAPGRVAWHRDFRTARTAARRSKKPVMLFQLLGRLDDRFC